MNYSKLKTIILLLVTVILHSGFVLANSRNDRTYVFGVVPQFDQIRIINIWNPVLKALSKHTGFKFILKTSNDITDFEKQYIHGDFDFAFMNPYFVLKAADQGYIPLVRDVDIDLQGIVVVKKNSTIYDVEELSGTEVGFPSPNSLGASLMLRADFKNKFKVSVLPVYLKTHSAVYRAVLSGKVMAGGGVQKSLAQQSYETRNALRVIYRTRFFPSHPIISHHRVPIADREKVIQALLDIAATSKGMEMLMKIPMHHLGITSVRDYEPIGTWGLEKFYKYY
ncbi:MAG: phosphate/phosphite/phosphonate ABC transporter substrate-binding protein [Gammaproteobacteria bacterium]|nr:phosphate/phosphite/phosphonate ABC transporter substrate-binding protein [Gammaproteobacteria bacterium]